jgi:hypothetical protein
MIAPMDAIDRTPGSVRLRTPAEGSHSEPAEAWSRSAGLWFRLHGFPAFLPHSPGTIPFEVAVAGAEPAAAGLVESPFAEGWLESVGLVARSSVVESIDIQVGGGPGFPGVGFSGDIVRRIPAARGERSEPHPWRGGEGCMRVPQLRVQFLEPGPSWERLVEATAPSGERGCIVARRGALTVMGAPLLAIASRYRWMPPVDEGYYAIERRCWSEAADLWLASLVEESACATGLVMSRESPWPNGHRSALTVRFDHDRLIPEESLQDMLSLLDAHGLRASWGFLARLSPPEVLAAVARRGHEVVLHSEAGSKAQLRAELDHFRAMGHDVRGVTAHGGIGSAGHLGQRLFEWAAAEGLEHADLLSRDTHLPSAAIVARLDGIGELPLFLPPSHWSLDTGTRPEAHALDTLAAELPPCMARGGLVTVMNHPDIHREQLRSLFACIDLSSAWRTTHLGAVRRAREVRGHWATA